VLHAKSCPIGSRSCCSTCLRGISNPPALLLCPTRAMLTQTPTPQNRRISVGGALKAEDPQTFMIYRQATHPPGLHSPARSLPGHAPQGLHSLAGTLFRWASASSPPWSLLWWPCPQGRLCWRYKHARSSFCWAMPPRPVHPCTIFTPQACAPNPAKPRTHTRMISVLLDCTLQACQARHPQTCRISTPQACMLQACQAHTPKDCYFTSAKGLHP
jgi:hypothetical protein